jgi:hypothetical protein
MSKRVYSVLAMSMLLLTVWACKKDDKKNEDTPKPVAANKAPTCVVTNPVDRYGYSIVGADTTLTIEVTASDSDGHVVKVDFYVDDVKVGADSTAPYSLDHVFLLTPVIKIKAVATDNEGAKTTSAVVNTAVEPR